MNTIPQWLENWEAPTMSRDKKEIRSVFVECRQWFDNSGGNTYHSVRVSVNGKPLISKGMTYGYGDQYEQTALGALIELGFEFTTDRPLWFQVQDLGADLYRSQSSTLKRELFKNWKIEDYQGI